MKTEKACGKTFAGLVSAAVRAQQTGGVTCFVSPAGDVAVLPWKELDRLRLLEREIADGKVERAFAENVLATGDVIQVANLINRLLFRQRRQEAVAVVAAAEQIAREFREMEAEQREKLVIGQTFESACENWKGLEKGVDFAPLMEALAAYGKAVE